MDYDIRATGLPCKVVVHWHDVLLDGPLRAVQIEKVKTIIRRMGEAGIPVLGYNFSLAGVCGRVTGRFGRGGAVTLGMDGPADEVPIPNGWCRT